MIRLLNIELQKIWQNRASKILTITYFCTLTLIALVGSIEFQFGPIKFEAAKSGIFNFPFIWHFNSFIASWFKLFLAVVVVSMIANEYSNGTLKQNLIDGLSKKEFMLSKFLTITLFAFISTIFVFVISLILGYKYSSYTELSIVCSGLIYLFAFFLKLIGFFSFCLFIAVLIKKSAFALGFIFVWFLIEKITFGVIKYEILDGNRKDASIMDEIFKFYPLESMANLIKEPFSRLQFLQTLSKTVGEDLTQDYSVHFSSILIVLAWTIIFMFLSYFIIKKRDL